MVYRVNIHDAFVGLSAKTSLLPAVRVSDHTVDIPEESNNTGTERDQNRLRGV